MTNPTLTTFLLDRSRSMESCKAATIEAFNAYLSGLQAEQDADIDFTFLQFDTVSLDKVCVAIPVKDAKVLNESTYLPRGGTPLIDAAVKTINAISASLTKREDDPKVVVCFQTDGEENSSIEHTWEELRGLISAKQEEGWQFNFMGAGIDAYVQGAKMGIGALATMSYDSSDIGATRNAFTASAMNATAYAAGRAASTSYNMEQRRASGDKFIPESLHGPLTANPMPLTSKPHLTANKPHLTANKPGRTLDLTRGLTDKPQTRRGTVSDLEL